MDYQLEISKLKQRFDILENNNYVPATPKKCLVKGCENRSDQGAFIGDLCSPCHDMITTGKVHHNNSTFIGDMQRKLDKYKTENIQYTLLVNRIHNLTLEE